MKNSYLFPVILVLSFISPKLLAQEELITLDFESKTFTDSIVGKGFKKGNFYKVCIENINLNLYKVSIKTKDTTIVKELKTPTFEDISFSNLSSLAASFNEKSISIKPQDTSQLLEGACEYIARDLKDSAIKLKENYIDNLDLLNDEFISLRTTIYKKRWDFYLSSARNNSTFDYITLLNTVSNINKRLSEISSELESDIKKYNDLLNGKGESSQCVENNKDLKLDVTAFLKLLNETKAKIDEFKKTLSPEKIDELIKSFFFLSDINNYESVPFQYIGDKEKITIDIEPKSPDYNLQHYTTSIFIPQFENDNYWSIGASFFISSLNDKKFSIIGTTEGEETTYMVFEEKNDDYEIGIATLMRYGWLCKNNFGSHLSFGPGINIGKSIRPRILIGGGFSVGDTHRFSLDIGGIVGYVDKQSNGIDINQIYTVIPETTTVTRINFGYFASIGYFFNL